MLVTVYDLVERGCSRLDDPLTVLKIDKVPGSGQLQFLHDNAVVTVRDAAWLMTTISDNTATNLLLDRIIIRRVWEKMERLGLPHTKVHSKSFLRIASVAMDSSVKYGLGVTTPNEMARLFALLAEGKRREPGGGQRDARHPRPQRGLREAAALRRRASTCRTRRATRTRCAPSAALFPLQSRIGACVLTKENEDQRYMIDNEAQVMMARMGDAIARAWPRRPSARQP